MLNRLVGLLILFTVSAHASSLCNHNCTLVIDAGSSGSRAHLYQYVMHSAPNRVTIKQLWSQHINPGLSTVTANANSIDAYFTILMNGAPQESYPIQILGTAGMRKLSQTEQQKRYDLAKSWFNAHFPGQLEAANTIPGQAEGVYGWLSTNYQLGLLQGDARQLASVIDMGGVSVQITMPTTEADANYTLHFFGHPIYLNSKSFLGLGQTQFEQQFAAEDSCYPLAFPLENGTVGRGNIHDCQLAITEGINNHSPVEQGVRDLIHQYNPEKWVVLGSIAYTADEKAIQFSDPVLTVRGLYNAADQNICLNNWYNLAASYPKDTRLSHYCLDASYYYAVLVNSFGLSDEQGLDRISNSESNDWTLGVVLSGEQFQETRLQE